MKWSQDERDKACIELNKNGVPMDKPSMIGDAAFDYLIELPCQRNALLATLEQVLYNNSSRLSIHDVKDVMAVIAKVKA